jgi:hypothetical protein
LTGYGWAHAALNVNAHSKKKKPRYAAAIPSPSIALKPGRAISLARFGMAPILRLGRSADFAGSRRPRRLKSAFFARRDLKQCLTSRK